MKDWKDIEKLLEGYPRSTGRRIPIDEEKELYHETLDNPMGVTYPSEKSDIEITNTMYSSIVKVMEINKEKQMYVRIYPEIVLSGDSKQKHSYFRIQFIDKVTWGESPIKDLMHKQLNGELT